MNNFDLANGLFELGGSICVWMNVFRLRKDRELKGVDWRVTAFFTLWGVFNMLLYPSLGLWFSMAAGAIVCLGNLVWVTMAVRLILEKRDNNE